jgi:hypothetical protein
MVTEDLVPVALKRPMEAHRLLDKRAREEYGADVELTRHVILYYPRKLLHIPHAPLAE